MRPLEDADCAAVRGATFPFPAARIVAGARCYDASPRVATAPRWRGGAFGRLEALARGRALLAFLQWRNLAHLASTSARVAA
jgi:hypothetical protein